MDGNIKDMILADSGPAYSNEPEGEQVIEESQPVNINPAMDPIKVENMGKEQPHEEIKKDETPQEEFTLEEYKSSVEVNSSTPLKAHNSSDKEKQLREDDDFNKDNKAKNSINQQKSNGINKNLENTKYNSEKYELPNDDE